MANSEMWVFVVYGTSVILSTLNTRGSLALINSCVTTLVKWW